MEKYGKHKKDGNHNSLPLLSNLEEFVNHIQELQIMDERIQRKVEKLEQQCQKEAKEFARKVQELQKSNQVNC